MDKFLKFVDEELKDFHIRKRLGGPVLFDFVQVWAAPMDLNKISAAAVGVGVGVLDLDTTLLLYPLNEEEEEEAWPPF